MAGHDLPNLLQRRSPVGEGDEPASSIIRRHLELSYDSIGQAFLGKLAEEKEQEIVDEGQPCPGTIGESVEDAGLVNEQPENATPVFRPVHCPHQTPHLIDPDILDRSRAKRCEKLDRIQPIPRFQFIGDLAHEQERLRLWIVACVGFSRRRKLELPLSGDGGYAQQNQGAEKIKLRPHYDPIMTFCGRNIKCR